jgi:hypothetical protein
MPELDYIKLSDLYLWNENPRFEPLDNEKLSIEKMIETLPDKIYKLAEDICKNGIIETIAVYKYNNKLTVYDGNRRITALKILSNPDLIKTNKKYFRKFSSLSLSDISYGNEIPAFIFKENEIEQLMIFLERRHIGEDSGRGLITWGSTQKDRFKYLRGHNTPLQNTLNFLEKNKYLTSNEINSVTRTNWERILTRPITQNFAKFDYKNGQLIINDEKEFASKIKTIADELKGKTVKIVYDNPAIEEFIHNLSAKSNLQAKTIENTNLQSNQVLPFEKSMNNVTPVLEESADKKITDTSKIMHKRNIKPSYERNTLIPANYKLSITDNRLNNIYFELRSMEIEKYSNAVAVLLRVFIELSIEHYLDINNINYSIDDNLRNKFSKVINDVKGKQSLTNDAIKPMDIAISNKNSIFSMRTFNSYVHNKNFNPIPKDLLLTWDNFSNLITILWSK